MYDECLKILFKFKKIKLKILYIFIMDVLKFILNFQKNILNVYLMYVLKFILNF